MVARAGGMVNGELLCNGNMSVSFASGNDFWRLISQQCKMNTTKPHTVWFVIYVFFILGEHIPSDYFKVSNCISS